MSAFFTPLPTVGTDLLITMAAVSPLDKLEASELLWSSFCSALPLAAESASDLSAWGKRVTNLACLSTGAVFKESDLL